MANIRVDLDNSITSGQGVIFKAPINCSDITGLIVYYPQDGETVSSVFDFADAHGNNVGGLNLFAEGALVKVILDTEFYRAYVQNSDTNDYLENEFKKRLLAIESTDYPGCYYRSVLDENGETETEWVNPPMMNGVEYRTLDRISGKPVYVQRHQLTILPGKSHTIQLPKESWNITVEPVQHIMDSFLIDPNVIGTAVPTVKVTPFPSALPPMIVLSVDSDESKGATVIIVIKYTKN